MTADVDPAHRDHYAGEVKTLLKSYGPRLLSAPEGNLEARTVWAAYASDIGFAAIRLWQSMGPDRAAILKSAIDLVTRSVTLSSPKERPVEYATYLQDLGHGLMQWSAVVEPSERTRTLATAAALFRESLVVYQVMRGKPEFAAAMAARPEGVDYLNLAHLNMELGVAYAASFDDESGFPASGIFFRAAFCMLAKARDISVVTRWGPDAVFAHNELAKLAIQLVGSCLEHTRSTRGSLRHAFHEWLCTIEGPVISTWDFAKRYGPLALRNAERAVQIARTMEDETLLHTALRTVFAVWRLAEMRHGVSGAPILFDDNRSNLASFRADALFTVERLLRSLLAPDEVPETAFYVEVKEYLKYFQGLLYIELFRCIGVGSDFLASAKDNLAWLAENGNLISRGLARPWASWLDVHCKDGEVAANGLFIGRGSKGLEIRVTAQRHSFSLEEVYLEDAYVELRESSWVKTHCLSSVAYLEPQISWTDVPALTPVIVARCRTAQGSFYLLAVRLPTLSWDTWALRIKKEFNGALALHLPFACAGKFDRERREFEGTGGVEARSPDQVLVFEQDRLILDVAAESGKDTLEPLIKVEPEDQFSCLEIAADEAMFSLRTSPQIVSSDTMVLAKTDSPWSAACCAASFPLVAPSLTTSAAMMRAFGPLFLFESEIPETVRTHIRQSSYHEILLAGVPSHPDGADDGLDLLFDPRRELFLLVEPAELTMASEAILRLKNKVDSSVGAPLFRLAASVDEDIDPFERIQVVEVSHSFAPAAAQMLLDVSSRRRFPIEDISSAIAHVQLLGNPGDTLRAITRLPNPVQWDELVAKYIELLRDSPFKTLGSSRGDARLERLMEISQQTLAARPCILVEGHATAILSLLPYARHLGAIVLPDTEEGRALCQRLSPPEVFCCEGSPWQDLPAAKVLPRSGLEMAKRFKSVAQDDHERRVRELASAHPSSAVYRRLSRQMVPSDYVVVASTNESEPWASFLAANYAAALGASLLLVDDSVLFELDRRRPQGEFLSGRTWTTHSSRGNARHLVAREADQLSNALAVSGRELDAALRELGPKYVGFVSARVFATIELVGNPPIATRYACGRLAGPDLESTSLLITHAALSEDVQREPVLLAVLSDAANAIPEKALPGVSEEVEALSRRLSAFPDVHVDRVGGPGDLVRFVELIRDSNIIHFAGHGSYDDSDAGNSSLIFEQGPLRAVDLTGPLRGFPIVFSNACETAVAAAGADAGRGWTGLAAAFISAGAVNYVGTLWPVFDDSSRRLSDRFYSLLGEGHSTGEALRSAREEARNAEDPIWAAMVLFGCPRNRLRAPGPGHSSV